MGSLVEDWLCLVFSFSVEGVVVLWYIGWVVSNEHIQRQARAALTDLAELNARGEVVSLEVLYVFSSDEAKTVITSEGLSIGRLFELLVDNPISYSSDYEDGVRSNELLGLIRSVLFSIDFERRKALGLFYDVQRTRLCLNMVKVWDKIVAPTFVGRFVLTEELDLFLSRAGAILHYHDPVVVEQAVRVLSSRLPKTISEWCSFSVESRLAFETFVEVSKFALQNEAYWKSYFMRQAVEYFGSEAIVPDEWSKELFDYPLAVPALS